MQLAAPEIVTKVDQHILIARPERPLIPPRRRRIDDHLAVRAGHPELQLVVVERSDVRHDANAGVRTSAPRERRERRGDHDPLPRRGFPHRPAN